MRSLMLGSLMLGLSVLANAAWGLEKGQSIPQNFQAKDSLARVQTFESLTGEKGLVLIFTRSADWCQYCKVQLKDWNAHDEIFAALGYQVAGISYDAPEKLAAFEQANDLSYMLLSDSDSAMIRAFGIQNEKFGEDSRFYGIPNPAIYVIGADGVIQAVFREEGYEERPQIGEVKREIDRLVAPKP